MMALSMFACIRLRTTETVWLEEISSRSGCTGSSRCAEGDVAIVQRIGVIFRYVFSAFARWIISDSLPAASDLNLRSKLNACGCKTRLNFSIILNGAIRVIVQTTRHECVCLYVPMAEQNISVEGAQTIAKTLTSQCGTCAKDRYPPARDCVTALDMSGEEVGETHGLPFLPAVVFCWLPRRGIANHLITLDWMFLALFSFLEAGRYAKTVDKDLRDECSDCSFH